MNAQHALPHRTRRLIARLKAIPVSRRLWYIAGLFALAAVLAGWEIFAREQQKLQAILHKDITTIADLKSRELARWYGERAGDAQVLLHSYGLIDDAVACAAVSCPAAARERIRARMTAYCEKLRYRNVLLLTAQGVPLLSAQPQDSSVAAVVRELAAAAAADQRIRFSDVYRDDTTQQLYIDFLVPLRAGAHLPAAGVVVLRTAPEDFLYPLLRHWPRNSASAETLLVRRDGDRVVFLNALAQRPGAPLTVHLPVSGQSVVAAQAVAGRTGLILARDYRGTPVVAAAQPVAGTRWVLIAKIDAQELYAPIREQFWVIALITALVIAIVGCAAGLFWYRLHVNSRVSRYQAEIDRLALVEHYSYLTKYANDAILLCDENLRVVQANERASELYGYSRKQLLACALSDLQDAPGAAAVRVLMAPGTADHGVLLEARQITAGGGSFPGEISARRITVQGHAFVQCVVRDCTERAQAQEKILQLNHELETRVQERTAALEKINEQLRQEIAERERAEQEAVQSRFMHASKMESLGKLAAGVAHELNNPLTVIMGNMQYLLSQPECAPDAREIYAEVEAATQRCRTIVTGLLEFARKKEVAFETCSVNSLLDQVLHLSAYHAEFKQLVVEKHFDSQLPPVKLSISHMEQVFLNLVSNAIQAMQGTGRLTITTRLAARRQAVEVLVADTGQGMETGQVARVFEPFYTTKEKGTGLGLAVSYSIVKQHGGEITAYSAGPGQGAVFTVTIPCG